MFCSYFTICWNINLFVFYVRICSLKQKLFPQIKTCYFFAILVHLTSCLYIWCVSSLKEGYADTSHHTLNILNCFYSTDVLFNIKSNIWISFIWQNIKKNLYLTHAMEKLWYKEKNKGTCFNEIMKTKSYLRIFCQRTLHIFEKVF